jgi:hypothetical protein
MLAQEFNAAVRCIIEYQHKRTMQQRRPQQQFCSAEAGTELKNKQREEVAGNELWRSWSCRGQPREIREDEEK